MVLPLPVSDTPGKTLHRWVPLDEDVARVLCRAQPTPSVVSSAGSRALLQVGASNASRFRAVHYLASPAPACPCFVCFTTFPASVELPAQPLAALLLPRPPVTSLCLFVAHLCRSAMSALPPPLLHPLPLLNPLVPSQVSVHWLSSLMISSLPFSMLITSLDSSLLFPLSPSLVDLVSRTWGRALRLVLGQAAFNPL